MATTSAHITWSPVSGSTGYLFEYKLQSDTTWTQPTVPPNPTLNNFYDITINQNVFYDIKITSFGANCSPRSITQQIFAPTDSCCPVGYTLSDDGNFCLQINITAATPPSASENAVSQQHLDYSAWGSLIYDQGFNINGTGTFTQISYTNPFWVNGTGFPSGGGLTLTAGPLNRTGVWTALPLGGQTVGYTVCVTALSDGVYYVGTAGDNYSTINVDGNNVLTMDPVAMAAYLNAHGYTGLGIEVAFRFWHIYPIFLTSGTHVIEIIGLNIAGPASIGAEVYAATPSQLMSAMSYVDLGSRLLFSSKDFIGQPVQIGSDGIGYTCISGYSLVLCDGPAYCKQVLTTPTISCVDTSVIYWGSNFTGLVPDEATILASLNRIANGALDVPIDWTTFNASPSYLWVAIPNFGTAYNKNQWFVDLLNQGAIGGPSNLFGDVAHVTVSGQDYFVWITNYETQFLQICIMQKV